MQNIEFIKMHGLGNDFVIIDQRINYVSISKEIISKLSDRKSGAGCDQLITILLMIMMFTFKYITLEEIKQKLVEMEHDVLLNYYLMKVIIQN